MQLPQNLINFVTKKIAGVLLYCLRRQAISLSEGSDKNMATYMKKVQEEPFYPWILAKVGKLFFFLLKKRFIMFVF